MAVANIRGIPAKFDRKLRARRPMTAFRRQPISGPGMRQAELMAVAFSSSGLRDFGSSLLPPARLAGIPHACVGLKGLKTKQRHIWTQKKLYVIAWFAIVSERC